MSASAERERTAFGAELREGGGTAFRLWAPSVPSVEVEIERDGARRFPMARRADGWHEAFVKEAGAGTRYRYALSDGLRVPDPASRFNPDDVHGPSVVVDPDRYAWQDAAWRGRPWHEAVIYELHVGTFTPQGTFAAAKGRLADLQELGITAIELMPVADFPGARNWGYDGVLPFAPDASYGKPDELKELIDTAHSLGLMVLLDVVYNHFGPDGNYLHVYCPEFFNRGHHTPWGSAINFDGDSSAIVRRFFCENALYWIEEFHFDGLRLDAIDRIRDDSATHIVCEIAAMLREGPGAKRHVHVIIENDANQAVHLERSAANAAPLCAVAQWNDDFHHAAHVALTGQTDGYYQDFAEDPFAHLARSLAQGFSYQGQRSAHRNAAHGFPSAHLPPSAFISYLQNHDQIGNRAFGERIDALADRRLVEAMHACLLLSPHVPMLFMGEEFAASTPFLYFCDFAGDLGQAVSDGRRAEFARFAAFANESARETIADPNDARTFESSKLRWEERDSRAPPIHLDRLDLIRELLALRRSRLTPRMAGSMQGGAHRSHGGVVRVEWMLGDGSPWHMLANLGVDSVVTGAAPAGSVVYRKYVEERSDGTLELASGAVLVVMVESGE